jgi:hypothetical protein
MGYYGGFGGNNSFIVFLILILLLSGMGGGYGYGPYSENK